MLDTAGFEVIDLGIDVPIQKFVDAIKETGAGVVGLSGFLTLAFDAMKTPWKPSRKPVFATGEDHDRRRSDR